MRHRLLQEDMPAMKGNASKGNASKSKASKGNTSKGDVSNKNASVLRTVGYTLASMFICVVLLVTTACIPRSLIQRQSEKSAEYFAQRKPFAVLLSDYVNSMQDNYSDTILLDILYCIDSEQPFSSVIRAPFAREEEENAYEGYLAAVKEGREPNQEYGRYWHGSMVLLRPLMIFMPVAGIRILCGTAIVMLQAAVVAVLWRRKRRAFGLCYLLGFLLIHPWMLFHCLEYGMVFLVASAASLVMVLKRRRTPAFTYPFFAVVGVITCFVDFLTTETLTFTLPMLLLIAEQGLAGEGRDTEEQYLSGRNSNLRGQTSKSVGNGVIAIIKNGICWLGGYLGMFVLKIVLLTVVAGKDAMLSSMSQGFLRLGGEVMDSNASSARPVGALRRFSGSIWHNLACLYPTHAGKMEAAGIWLTTLVIVAIGFAVIYLLHGAMDWTTIILMVGLALLPYLRFLALSNHSYIHFFFTYRAQMVTLVVFFWLVWRYGLIRLARRKKRR